MHVLQHEQTWFVTHLWRVQNRGATNLSLNSHSICKGSTICLKDFVTVCLYNQNSINALRCILCLIIIAVSFTGAGTLRSWLVDSSGLDQLTKDITTTQHHVQQLVRLLDNIEHQDDISVSMEYSIHLSQFLKW